MRMKNELVEHSELIAKAESVLDFKFKNKNILFEAMVHKSFANEKGLYISNERLEFLGDAVLGFVVGEYLMKKMLEDNEGELAKKRAMLVSEEALSKVAEDQGFDRYLLLGKGAKREKAGRKSNLADFTEALIGAIYLDRGMRAAKKFIVEKLILPYISTLESSGDYKSELQEYTIAVYKQFPKYRVVEVRGPVHERIYTVEVLVNRKIYGVGQGRSKKLAEKKAAKNALMNLRKKLLNV